MRAAQAAALGVAQGIAEVVPVSSSAQLVLLPWLLRWEQPADRTAFAAALHAGSCAGIAWGLREDLRALDLRTSALVAASTVPAAVAGLLAADAVEQRLGRPPQLAALLAGAGAALWWADRRAEQRAAPGRPTADEDAPASHRPGRGARSRWRAPRDAPAPRDVAWAAAAQVAALVPGVSRSGATLTALRLCGVERSAAVRFTMLMSLPITAGAAVLTLARSGPAAARTAAPGVVSAAVAGATTVTLSRRRAGGPVTLAALYRLGLAAVVLRRLVREGEL